MLNLKNILYTTDLDEMIRINFIDSKKYIVSTVSDILIFGPSEDLLNAKVNGITKSSDKNILFDISVAL